MGQAAFREPFLPSYSSGHVTAPAFPADIHGICRRAWFLLDSFTGQLQRSFRGILTVEAIGVFLLLIGGSTRGTRPPAPGKVNRDDQKITWRSCVSYRGANPGLDWLQLPHRNATRSRRTESHSRFAVLSRGDLRGNQDDPREKAGSCLTMINRDSHHLSFSILITLNPEPAVRSAVSSCWPRNDIPSLEEDPTARTPTLIRTRPARC